MHLSTAELRPTRQARAFGHNIPSDDPDLAQAIEDLAPRAQYLREQSARLLELPQGSPHRRAVQSNIRDTMAAIDLRAQRIGTTGAALVEILNVFIDARARRGRAVPQVDTSRTLLTRLTDAIAQEDAAAQALRQAQTNHEIAIAQRRAVEQACEAFGIPRIVR